MQFRQTKLPNGLTIIAELNGDAYSSSIGFFVKTGSRNESVDLLGVSHFLEHLVFKGSASLSAIEVNCRLDDLGADANAFTEEEQTVFHITVLPEFVGAAIDLLGDILRPAFRKRDFEMERQVILEEIRMYCEQPPFGADAIIRKIFFGGHPLANSVIGLESTVSNLSIDQLRAYHAARYTPENIVVAGTGKIEFDYFCDCVKRACGKWESSGLSRNKGDQRYRINGAAGFHKITKKSVSQQYTMMLSNAPSGVDSDFFPALILSDIIGDVVGSRFYWEFIDNGVADTAGMSIQEYSDNGFFDAVLASEPAAMKKIIENVKKIFADITKNGITKGELERAKNKTLSRIIIGSEGSDGRLFTVGGDWVMTGKYRTLQQESEIIQNITIENVNTIIKKYPLNNPLILTIGPTK
ncbi:MAG: insulinase family protein [Planctomycetaceae bacterium]|jgi:predicted Zn-dependent peptidase|nr:insulinase family protein [Planctomycetaceae bacterium]